MGISKNALFPRLPRQLRARTLMYYRTLRFSARCFLALEKKSLFLEKPIGNIILSLFKEIGMRETKC
jgi:hypothetical protein